MIQRVRLGLISLLLILVSGIVHATLEPSQRAVGVTQSYPYSDSEFGSDVLGVIPQLRLALSFRSLPLLSDDSPDPNLADVERFTSAKPNDSIAPSCTLACLSRLYSFIENYRLAGWKETNALYVALNSQF
ncbi:hypothetical protein HGP28_04345 [Vibrio sp. SM6]|uniref:Uncharacterized protein n=1 Tax=Vibrio agarilyticus TaxID=2726741 RepID=A0A7X8TNR3_9VIBR|nr:hypothetical protein [Vibrio agarilyticus]NLS12123.1 hypothetical protein [Vibrio agarilyticus]